MSPSLTSCSGARRRPARHFDADLVGLEAGDRLVGRDGFAGLLQPLGERASVINSPSGGLGRQWPWSSFTPRRDGGLGAAAMAERRGNQGRLLGGMALGEAGRRRSPASRPAYCGRRPLKPGLVQAAFEQRLDEDPGAVVLRLFLRPDQGLELGHRLQALDQRLGRERIELLDADDLDVDVAGLVARLHQLIGELARAQHQPPRLAFGRRIEVGKDAAEMAVAGEIGECSTPRACAAAATWASSGSAACGNRAASGAAGCGNNWPAWCSWRPGYCPRRTAADSARAGPSYAPAPALRSRAEAASRARWRAAIWPRRRR